MALGVLQGYINMTMKVLRVEIGLTVPLQNNQIYKEIISGSLRGHLGLPRNQTSVSCHFQTDYHPNCFVGLLMGYVRVIKSKLSNTSGHMTRKFFHFKYISVENLEGSKMLTVLFCDIFWVFCCFSCLKYLKNDTQQYINIMTINVHLWNIVISNG